MSSVFLRIRSCHSPLYIPLNLCGIFVLGQNALLHELLRVWPRLETLLKVVSPHVEVELPLVSL
jgi:hypothetical protein